MKITDELTEVQVKEMEIELLKEKLRYMEVENDKLTEQLNLGVVSHRRELLLDFLNVLDINNLLEPNIERITIDDIDEYLKI